MLRAVYNYLRYGYSPKVAFTLQQQFLNISNMEMTSLNRVELRGHVGQNPKITTVGESQVARFSIATNETYKDKRGDLKEETTWHNISAWNGRAIDDFSSLKKGAYVSLVGKIRNVRYTSSTGEERQFSEVVASRLSVLQPSSQP